MYNSLTAANCRRLPSMDFSSAVVNQAFLSPSAPDFSGGAPDGYVVGTNLNITFYTSPIFDSSSVSKGDPPPFSARLISYFDSEPKPDLGISLFGGFP